MTFTKNGEIIDQYLQNGELITDRNDIVIRKYQGGEYIFTRLKNTFDHYDQDLTDSSGYFILFKDDETDDWNVSEEKVVFETGEDYDLTKAVSDEETDVITDGVSISGTYKYPNDCSPDTTCKYYIQWKTIDNGEKIEFLVKARNTSVINVGLGTSALNVRKCIM